jgi:hypothetical protein
MRRSAVRQRPCYPPLDGNPAYYKQSLFPACFANGLPLSEARVLDATAEPLSPSG